ncbi:hypothetical protein DENSPDRAFT_844624 [Dentipellis sp. KUC8613]|nr:hypothetical protein DENSPDRAFT_844624 [Dentipellis sp. KUC8613]
MALSSPRSRAVAPVSHGRARLTSSRPRRVIAPSSRRHALVASAPLRLLLYSPPSCSSCTAALPSPSSRVVMPARLRCALLVPSRYFLALSLYPSLCIYLAPG